MGRALLKSFVLKVSIEVFIKEFWENGDWWRSLLTDELGDLSVDVGPWTESTSDQSSSKITRERRITSFHPFKVPFPGLPSHAESLKIQSIYLSRKQSKLAITETNTFSKIPFSDYFSVLTDWVVIPREREGTMECAVDIYLNVEFHKITLLQVPIETNTKSELLEVYEKWECAAKKRLEELAKSSEIVTSMKVPKHKPKQAILVKRRHSDVSRHTKKKSSSTQSQAESTSKIVATPKDDLASYLHFPGYDFSWTIDYLSQMWKGIESSSRR